MNIIIKFFDRIEESLTELFIKKNNNKVNKKLSFLIEYSFWNKFKYINILLFSLLAIIFSVSSYCQWYLKYCIKVMNEDFIVFKSIDNFKEFIFLVKDSNIKFLTGYKFELVLILRIFLLLFFIIFAQSFKNTKSKESKLILLSSYTIIFSFNYFIIKRALLNKSILFIFFLYFIFVIMMYNFDDQLDERIKKNMLGSLKILLTTILTISTTLLGYSYYKSEQSLNFSISRFYPNIEDVVPIYDYRPDKDENGGNLIIYRGGNNQLYFRNLSYVFDFKLISGNLKALYAVDLPANCYKKWEEYCVNKNNYSFWNFSDDMYFSTYPLNYLDFILADNRKNINSNLKNNNTVFQNMNANGSIYETFYINGNYKYLIIDNPTFLFVDKNNEYQIYTMLYFYLVDSVTGKIETKGPNLWLRDLNFLDHTLCNTFNDRIKENLSEWGISDRLVNEYLYNVDVLGKLRTTIISIYEEVY